jgi:quercetin dioxygenase-like cupin family protein
VTTRRAGGERAAQHDAQDELAGRLHRTVLQRAELAAPGREVVQVLTEIPAGVESGWHVHPGEEIGYILGGTVHMMLADGRTLVLEPGSPFLIPPRSPHNALDVGPGVGRMLSTYVVEIGEPLATVVEPPGHAAAPARSRG